jgi:class 3 adenylate cyclase
LPRTSQRELLAREHTVNCQTQGSANVAAARFCNGFGGALRARDSAGLKAERRHVCVPFCDLVGSTPLSQQPGDLRIVVSSGNTAP